MKEGNSEVNTKSDSINKQLKHKPIFAMTIVVNEGGVTEILPTTEHAGVEYNINQHQLLAEKTLLQLAISTTLTPILLPLLQELGNQVVNHVPKALFGFIQQAQMTSNIMNSKGLKI